MDFNRQDSKTRLRPLDDQKMFEIMRRSSEALETAPPLRLNVEVDRRSECHR